MEVSKVQLSERTKFEMINNPLLKNPKAKARFRKQKIKEYIASKPAGYKFTTRELGYVGGYNDNQMGTAWTLLKKMKERGEINVEDTPSIYKEMSVPDGAVEVEKLEKPTTEESIQENKEIAETGTMIDDIAFAVKVEKFAVKFSWQENSNDLREFIKWLK